MESKSYYLISLVVVLFLLLMEILSIGRLINLVFIVAFVIALVGLALKKKFGFYLGLITIVTNILIVSFSLILVFSRGELAAALLLLILFNGLIISLLVSILGMFCLFKSKGIFQIIGNRNSLISLFIGIVLASSTIATGYIIPQMEIEAARQPVSAPCMPIIISGNLQEMCLQVEDLGEDFVETKKILYPDENIYTIMFKRVPSEQTGVEYDFVSCLLTEPRPITVGEWQMGISPIPSERFEKTVRDLQKAVEEGKTIGFKDANIYEFTKFGEKGYVLKSRLVSEYSLTLSFVSRNIFATIKLVSDVKDPPVEKAEEYAEIVYNKLKAHERTQEC